MLIVFIGFNHVTHKREQSDVVTVSWWQKHMIWCHMHHCYCEGTKHQWSFLPAVLMWVSITSLHCWATEHLAVEIQWYIMPLYYTEYHIAGFIVSLGSKNHIPDVIILSIAYFTTKNFHFVLILAKNFHFVVILWTKAVVFPRMRLHFPWAPPPSVVKILIWQVSAQVINIPK